MRDAVVRDVVGPIEPLEDRRLLSATVVAGKGVAAHKSPAATVKPLKVSGVKRNTVITPAGDVSGSYTGDFTPADGAFQHCEVSVGAGDGAGRYAGSITLRTIDPQTEAYGPPRTIKLVFGVDAAGNVRAISILPGKVVVFKGRFVDGTVQGTYQETTKGGALRGDVSAYGSFA